MPFPQDYAARVREGYLVNAIAQRAVRLVAEAVGTAPITAVPAAAAGAAADPQAAARLLALVQTTSGGQALLETVALQLMLHGNAYIQLIADEAGLGESGTDTADVMTSMNGAAHGVRELYALRPDRVSVEADARGWPAAYLYRVGGAVTRIAASDAFGRARIVHIRGHHPLDDHYGLGALAGASGAIAIHNAAARWNTALLDNAARPSGALVYEGGDGAVLSADQFARLKAEMEAGFAGSGNAGRPMLLEGGLRWQAMSLTPADMDFAEAKASAAREIALAFGVPPMLLGLPGDATYANYREASKALWRQTILPLATKILDALGQALGARLAVDLDRVPALAEDRERLWRQVGAAAFLSRGEKRALLGIADHGAGDAT